MNPGRRTRITTSQGGLVPLSSSCFCAYHSIHLFIFVNNNETLIMGKAESKSSNNMHTLPIVPLATSSVLLPGVTLRIPLQRRSDIAAILASIYSKAATPRPDATAVTVGCVPLNSPYLSPDGTRLIEDGSQKPKQERSVEPAQAKAKDLYRYGTLARVSGVQGRGALASRPHPQPLNSPPRFCWTKRRAPMWNGSIQHPSRPAGSGTRT